MMKGRLLGALALFSLFLSCGTETGLPYCAIHIIDAKTGRGIPAIRLESLNKASYITDSQGFIAYYEDGLMDSKVYFEIDAEGYRTSLDATGRHAVSLQIEAGGAIELPLVRDQPAERLYRSTGHGIYRESVLLGKPVPIQHPAINAGVLGQDSNLAALYKSKVFWIWGDTFLPGEYNGNFSVAAATSLLPADGGLDRDIGVDLSYFKDEKGESKSMIALDGPGYTWFEWLLNVPDESGNERLVAKYARVGGLWQNYERGVAVFNDSTEVFEKYSDSKQWIDGYAVMHHPFEAQHGNAPYFFLTSEFEFTRVAMNLDSLANPDAYVTYTCFKQTDGGSAAKPELERDEIGRLVFDWKRDAPAITSANEGQLIASGEIAEDEAWVQLRDINTNRRHQVGRGAINWNPARQKWILIAQGEGVTQGEIIYAEADSPIGPWAYATVVAEHDNLYYNPVHHPFFDDGHLIYFEGTYTNFWSQGTTKPYYDYNQLVYSLDLRDERAMLPSAVYRLQNGDLEFATTLRSEDRWDEVVDVAFYAFEPKHHPQESVPVYKAFNGQSPSFDVEGEGQPFMYALQGDSDAGNRIVGHWECHLSGFEAIDAYLPMKISRSGDEWSATTTSTTFKITEVTLEDQQLSISVTQYDKLYTLTCNLNTSDPGMLKGEWRKNGSESSTTLKGVWKARCNEDYWLPGFAHYCIELDSQGRTPSQSSGQTAVCRVWPNTHNQLFLDPTIVAISDHSGN